MGKLDTSQCDGRTPEGHEASHRGAPAFYRSMILLNRIVEILAASHLDVLPLRILPPMIPKACGHRALSFAATAADSSKALYGRMLGQHCDLDEAESPPSCRAYRQPGRETSTCLGLLYRNRVDQYHIAARSVDDCRNAAVLVNDPEIGSKLTAIHQE
jgi:hypothetical protein